MQYNVNIILVQNLSFYIVEMKYMCTPYHTPPPLPIHDIIGSIQYDILRVNGIKLFVAN